MLTPFKPLYFPLVYSTREQVIDEVYFGCAFLFDEFSLLKKFGDDAQKSFFMRSLSKPVQASIITDFNLISQLNLTDEEIAICCASHTGTKTHTALVRSILNKAGQLTEEEREIMQLHSELGYELLKNKNLSENALGLVKYHHQNPKATGYPAINDNFVYGIDTQILNAADKYSALREKRSYKEPLSREEALKVMREDVKKGIISQEVYNALERAV